MKKMMKTNKLAIAITFILFIACKEEADSLRLTDPFMEAFQNKKIKYMIGRKYRLGLLPNVTNDTTEFNEKGNIIYYKQWGSEVFTSYNDSNFVTRFLRVDDIPSNYWITYSVVNGVLLQQWNRLNHFDWNFKVADIRDTMKIVEFRIDKNGKVIREIDKFSGQLTIFEYDKGYLANKKVCSISDSTIFQNWTYIYDGSQLAAIVVSERDIKLMNYYYKDGLLDSLSTPDHSIKYNYIFRK